MGLGKCSAHILVGYCQEDPGVATPAAHVLSLPSSGNLWALESKCQKKRCWEEVLVSGKSVSVTGQPACCGRLQVLCFGGENSNWWFPERVTSTLSEKVGRVPGTVVQVWTGSLDEETD